MMDPGMSQEGCEGEVTAIPKKPDQPQPQQSRPRHKARRKSQSTAAAPEIDIRYIEHLKETLKSTQAKLDATTQELKEKTSELELLSFLGRPNSCSYADVTRLFEDLNEAIYQISIQSAEWTTFSLNHDKLQDLEKVWHDLLRYHVSPLDPKLFCDNPSMHELWVQYVLQAHLVRISQRILAVEWPGMDHEAEKTLNHLYQRFLYFEENRSLARQWRRTTQRLARNTTAPYDPDYLTQLISGDLHRIMSALGAVRSDGKADTDYERVFYEPMRHIVDIILKIDIALHEMIVSADLVPVLAGIGTPFEAKSSEDVDGELTDGKGMVLACVALGLSALNLTTDGSFAMEVLLKPHVVLDSMFKQG